MSSLFSSPSPLPQFREDLLSDPEYTRKKITLTDGRMMSYSECGNLESGHPVLFQMGLMGSSLAVIAVHEQAVKADLRLICLDYPGIGESTNVPNRTMLDWGSDVEEFFQQVLSGHDKISLLGHCMGVPHIMAAWPKLSHRVSHITLVAPWVGETQTNPWWMRNIVQKLPGQSTYLPAVSASVLAGTTYFNYPMSYIVGDESVSKLLRALHEIHLYNRFQGNGGNREMLRLAFESPNKEVFWDPILAKISEEFGTGDHTETIPVHVLHGSDDAMVSQEGCRKFVGWLQDMKLEVVFTTLEKADHNSILLDPTYMANVLQTSRGNGSVSEIGLSPNVD
ncbi:Alpha beta hydrolase fold [Seminavis robusta]|uniref:Alpha beta hydrolase fold n=1 Tax=Seminavis robusta TaxID=568900 RepID=A0A9N8E6P3_9STRA|nr:Alpha beta hydrolase fold [Seminavis robusta]|eukprot:Sro720_g192510.1 Alpha beta hydrolase fold (337) ;mRNA; f:7102-8112